MAALVNLNDPFQPLPAAMVARRLGVSRQLFNSWVRSGKLEPADHGAGGRPLYRHVDAAAVEEQTRNSPSSSRRRTPVGASV